MLKYGNDELARQLSRARAYRVGFDGLKKSNWVPDVVIAHSGWGCGVYVKEIWPHTTFISYLEWWFDPDSDLIHSLKNNQYFKLSDIAIKNLWTRNVPSALEMVSADHLITPTEWQKKQLPIQLRQNCQVVPDTIDNNLFFPEPKKLAEKPVLTYGTRGMEPMRGFPEFIKIIPSLLQKWPHLSVEIAGSDTISYGGNRPKEKSWKKWALNILKSRSITSRVTWKGTMPLVDYANWIKSSWCHIYLSEPFVTSWSFIEAMHCHVSMVASEAKSTLEFENINPNMITANHKNSEELFDAINNRIRFSANSVRERRSRKAFAQNSNDVLNDSGQASGRHQIEQVEGTTLLSIIADVEATTKV